MPASNSLDIEYVARLARIELSDAEKARFSAQLGQVLDYFEQLKAVDVSGVEPSAHAYDLFNVWREDVPVEGFSPEAALANAPAQRAHQIQVPKVIDEA